MYEKLLWHATILQITGFLCDWLTTMNELNALFCKLFFFCLDALCLWRGYTPPAHQVGALPVAESPGSQLFSHDALWCKGCRSAACLSSAWTFRVDIVLMLPATICACSSKHSVNTAIRLAQNVSGLLASSNHELASQVSTPGHFDAGCLLWHVLLDNCMHAWPRHSIWRKCSVRVFVVADNAQEQQALKHDVELFLYDLRMEANVIVLTVCEDSSKRLPSLFFPSCCVRLSWLCFEDTSSFLSWAFNAWCAPDVPNICLARTQSCLNEHKVGKHLNSYFRTPKSIFFYPARVLVFDRWLLPLQMTCLQIKVDTPVVRKSWLGHHIKHTRSFVALQALPLARGWLSMQFFANTWNRDELHKFLRTYCFCAGVCSILAVFFHNSMNFTWVWINYSPHVIGNPPQLFASPAISKPALHISDVLRTCFCRRHTCCCACRDLSAYCLFTCRPRTRTCVVNAIRSGLTWCMISAELASAFSSRTNLPWVLQPATPRPHPVRLPRAKTPPKISCLFPPQPGVLLYSARCGECPPTWSAMEVEAAWIRWITRQKRMPWQMRLTLQTHIKQAAVEPHKVCLHTCTPIRESSAHLRPHPKLLAHTIRAPSLSLKKLWEIVLDWEKTRGLSLGFLLPTVRQRTWKPARIPAWSCNRFPRWMCPHLPQRIRMQRRRRSIHMLWRLRKWDYFMLFTRCVISIGCHIPL